MHINCLIALFVGIVVMFALLFMIRGGLIQSGRLFMAAREVREEWNADRSLGWRCMVVLLVILDWTRKAIVGIFVIAYFGALGTICGIFDWPTIRCIIRDIIHFFRGEPLSSAAQSVAG